MKILFDHPLPFALAHGGFQIQLERTKEALESIGVTIELLRWWDEDQRGDVIHYFGRPMEGYITLAQDKGIKVVVGELHSGLGSRSNSARAIQKGIMRVAQAVLPGQFTDKFAWRAYRQADAFVALTGWEAQIMRDMFDADPARIHMVPNGVEPVFFRPHTGGDYLICTAAIHPRKRIVELATACAKAKVPVWIVGKPYAETDEYHRQFLAVQQVHPEFVRYEGVISDREKLAEIYGGSRGFVLLSTQESLSLSALEAAAAGCPLLLSDLPWARTVFGDQASYVSANLEGEALAAKLRDFHQRALSLPASFQPLSWKQVAISLAAVYEKVLRT